MNDNSKINLKNLLEEQIYLLEEYEKVDDHNYPGWTFLVDAVTTAYGTCPFLNVYDPESLKRRENWLHSKPDEGKLYYQVISELTDTIAINSMAYQLESIKKKMVEYVTNIIKNLDLANEMTYDDILENIKMRKEARSQNKKVKDTWNMTVLVLDEIAVKSGVDFSKYVKVIYGYILRYAFPPNATGDPVFEELLSNFNTIFSKWQTLKNYREKEKNEAMGRLAKLIQRDFQTEQNGRYFKKWSSLKTHKKEERISSYCDWYARQMNEEVIFADDMKIWIKEKLATKELRITDIKWDSKLGIITAINLDIDEGGNFNVGKRAPRVLKSRKTSKKKREESFQSEKEQLLLQRANRLILYEIVKNGIINKENTVNNVMQDLQTRIVPRAQILDYISCKYDEMTTLVKQHKGRR